MNEQHLLKLLHELAMLKRVKREGWRIAGVESPESVADHSLRTAQIAYFIARMEGADAQKACTIAAFHELAECRIGDLHKIASRYLKKDESKVVGEQTAPLDKTGDDLFKLWTEFENQSTLEGIIAKDADLVEVAITAREYEANGKVAAHDWMVNAEKHLKTKSAKKLVKLVYKSNPHEWWNGLKKIER